MSATRPDAAHDALIFAHVSLATARARRRANRGRALDDLEHATMGGLITAVDRFDSTRGTDLRALATATILGEPRRHCRDMASAIRVPRGLTNEDVVTGATSLLANRLRRSPTVAEIAGEATLTDEQVPDAMAAHAADHLHPLSRSPSADADGGGIEIPVDEHGDLIAEGRTTLREGLARLPARERVSRHLRFDQGMI